MADTSVDDGPCTRCSFPLNDGDNEEFVDHPYFDYGFKGITPLFCAAYRNHYKCIKIYLQAGANVNYGDSYVNTALHLVRDPDCMQLLLESGADVHAVNKMACIPMHASMPYKCLELLVKAGSKVNKRAKCGDAPLHAAYDWRSVKLLLQVGADVNIKTREGCTPLHCCMMDGPSSLLEIWHPLIVNPKDRQKSVELLLKAGANVNAVDKRGLPPLFYAVGHLSLCSTVRSLINAGANVNLRDKYGSTPLMWTKVHFKSFPKFTTKYIRLLLEAGADVNTVVSRGQNKGQTVLFESHPNWIKLFLKEGARINVIDCNGYNALQHHLKEKRESESILLFVCGERLVTNTMKKSKRGRSTPTVRVIPNYLNHEDIRLRLDHMCREAIRKHVIDLDSHTHLFNRIPLLPLRASVKEYLLYNKSLDESDNEDDPDSDDGETDLDDDNETKEDDTVN